MSSYNWSTLDAPRTTQWTLSFFRHQAVYHITDRVKHAPLMSMYKRYKHTARPGHAVRSHHCAMRLFRANFAYSRLTSLLSMSTENEAITANIGGCFEGLDCVQCVAYVCNCFLANVNSRSRSLYAIARPSVCLSVVCLSVCNVRAPYSGG